jgi:hypothetical protein
LAINAEGQTNVPSKETELYDQIKAFSLTGGVVDVKGFVLKRDRGQMTFDGTFYLSAPANGIVTGAVFIGEGKFSAAIPPSEFEKDNVKRLLGATEVVEADFKTAVLRFSDDTARLISEKPAPAPANDRAQKLATDLDQRILRESGANLAARLTLSILNGEKPGFFFANFDGGKRRFSFLLDYQTRVPVSAFGINAGEKGLLFAYDSSTYDLEIWMAFYSLEDYQRRIVSYSDVNNLVDIKSYDMDIDLRDHKKYLRLRTQIGSTVLQPNVKALNFQIGESLGEFDSVRLKKQMRLKAARLGDAELASIQEDWEGGFTVFLPRTFQAGEQLNLDLLLEGDFIYDTQVIENCHYPRSNTSWFPRHGELDRATFAMTFRHPKKLKVATVGQRVSEEPDPEDKDVTIVKYKMDEPVALVTFALGPFERHADTIKWESGKPPTPLEFNSLPGAYLAIKEDFILAELNNSVRYFTAVFGDYPYPSFGAAVHPFGFGQGFPSLLMIPPADRATKNTYRFIAHETAHQWWGNIVAWRSYRDQWLSEGFAEYSGVLYTGLRESPGARDELISLMRSSLRDKPLTRTGFGSGRLVDVGPIILGHRLDTKKTEGAYTTLIYDKGALVLRMLHFLLSDPASGDSKPFFAMMSDFVNRYRNQFASTDDFREVANEHFAKSPIGQRYRISNLNWFFRQWVYQTGLPTYEMQYRIEDQPDGKVILSGNIVQDNVPDDWAMVLPVQISFGNNQFANGPVIAKGKSTPFQIRLPMRPKKVELDPQHWILSERTSTKSL